MEPGSSETLTIWKKADITHHMGVMQHFRDRVLRKRMVPKRTKHKEYALRKLKGGTQGAWEARWPVYVRLHTGRYTSLGGGVREYPKPQVTRTLKEGKLNSSEISTQFPFGHPTLTCPGCSARLLIPRSPTSCMMRLGSLIHLIRLPRKSCPRV